MTPIKQISADELRTAGHIIGSRQLHRRFRFFQYGFVTFSLATGSAAAFLPIAVDDLLSDPDIMTGFLYPFTFAGSVFGSIEVGKRAINKLIEPLMAANQVVIAENIENQLQNDLNILETKYRSCTSAILNNGYFIPVAAHLFSLSWKLGHAANAGKAGFFAGVGAVAASLYSVAANVAAHRKFNEAADQIALLAGTHDAPSRGFDRARAVLIERGWRV